MGNQITKIKFTTVDDCIKCTPRHGGYKQIKEIVDSVSQDTKIGFQLINVYREMETTKKVRCYTVHLEINSKDFKCDVLRGLGTLTDALKVVPDNWSVYVHSLGYSDDEDHVATVYINILIDND
jgi:hypothetical protein